MENRNQQRVYAKFPDTGLGNKLLVWAKAFAFSQTHQLELYCSKWWGVHLGSWIRNEKQKRLYLGYFREDSFLKKIRLFIFRLRARIIAEPNDLIKTDKAILYQFNEVVTSRDYFEKIKPFREEIKRRLIELLTPELQKELAALESPVIGIHIRRGDFKFGSTMTPLSYFIDVIAALRKQCGKELPVTVFTDAFEHEISDLLKLPSVMLSSAKADILDILQLSRSKICVLSISSTFSFWGGFLSDGIVLTHPDEWHPSLRPVEINNYLYEGKFDPALPVSPILYQQLMQISIE